MWSLGFGLEHIGLWAIRFPKLVTAALFALCVFAVSTVIGLKFDGNVTSVLPEDSQAYSDYFAQKEAYRDASKDVTLIVRSARLLTASGLEDLRTMQIEMGLADGVENATSVFSVPRPDVETGELEPFFPEFLEDDAQAKQYIDELLVRQPQASALISPDHNLAVIRLILSGNETATTDQDTYRRFDSIKAEIEDIKPNDFEVLYTGLTPLGLTIVKALISDQMKLTLIGLLFGSSIAFYVFRSILGALICAIPPAITALWTLCLFSVTGNPLNYLTTILPTLALILAFADGIVLYYRWQQSNVEGDDFLANLREAIRRVGPASALTSVTTALAFLSFTAASSTALNNFAYLGVGAVFAAFMAVIIALPIAAYWANHFGLIKKGKVRAPVFASLGAKMHKFVAPRALFIAGLAILAVVGLSYSHSALKAEYRITDYLPFQSDARVAEGIANDVLKGGSVLFVSVPLVVDSKLSDKSNRDLLARVERELAKIFAPSQLYSLNAIWSQLTNETAALNMGEQLLDVDPASRTSFLSNNGDEMLISVRLPSSQSISTTSQQVVEISKALENIDLTRFRVSGMPVLMATEFTNLIEQLRRSLLIAIFLGVVVIGIATRSPVMSLAAITPNLIPILMIEFVIFLNGGTVNLSQVISLTVAFGIAIDNAVHVINVLESERKSGIGLREGIRRAMSEVGPALGASTMIICVSTLVTQMSTLPMLPTLGQLMITTLIIALVSNLAILPANVLSLRAILPGMLGKKPGTEINKDT